MSYGFKSTLNIRCRITNYHPRDIEILVKKETVDQETGEITEHRKTFLLPRAKAKIDTQLDGSAIVTIPVWKAREIGLVR